MKNTMFNEINILAYKDSKTNQSNNVFHDVLTKIEIMFFGVKFIFSSKHGELNILVSGEPLFLIPCDGNNFKITSEKIILQMSEKDNEDKIAIQSPFRVERIGRKKMDSIFDSSLKMDLIIGEMVFEVSAINNGYILISSVDHGRIKVEPSASNAICVSATD